MRQVCFFSATLHSPAITELTNRICTHPTWVDLKGVDSVPETVHHVCYRVNPLETTRCERLRKLPKTPTLVTDGLHVPASVSRGSGGTGGVDEDKFSQQIKELKLFALIGIIDHFKVR